MFAKLLVLIATVAAVSARATWRDLDNYTFEHYIKEFGSHFKTSEMSARRVIFQNELDRVRAHNAKGLSWKEGINKFSIMTSSGM